MRFYHGSLLHEIERATTYSFAEALPKAENLAAHRYIFSVARKKLHQQTHMYYFIAFLAGLLGVLSLLRTGERLMTGGSILPVQLLFAVLGLFVAAWCVQKARTASRSKE